MAFAKRIFLFMAVNMLVVVTISLVASVFGIRPGMSVNGIEYQQLMIWCLLWGMGGALISLALSRIMAKLMMGVKVIDPNTSDHTLQALVQRVHQLARGAGLRTMPQVGIYDSPEVNAFATGPTRNRALVAVSTGLLHRMGEDELDGVLGHEIAHVANGDMVTMTLIQGIVNAFVMFLARVIAFFAAQALSSRRDSDEAPSPWLQFGIQMVLEIGLMFLGMMVVAWFSRWREFRADAGGARLAGRESMVNALRALQRTVELVDTSAQPAVQSMKISGRSTGFRALFSTHPPLELRIERLMRAG